MNKRVLLFLLLLLLAGCADEPVSGPPVLATVPVAGRVTRGGQPLQQVAVRFISTDGTITAQGTSDTNGQFKLTTYKNNDGAPPRMYVVVLADLRAQPAKLEEGLAPEPETIKPRFEAKYQNPDSSPIRVTIREDQTNEVIISLE